MDTVVSGITLFMKTAVISRWLPQPLSAQPPMAEAKAGIKGGRKTSFSSQEVQLTSPYKSLANAGSSSHPYAGI